MPLSRKCIIPGCDHLQNSLVSLIIKLLEDDSRETVAFPRVGVVSAPPLDTPPAYESGEYCLFFQDFDALFYLLGAFLAFKYGWVVNNKFNIEFTRPLTFLAVTFDQLNPILLNKRISHFLSTL